MVLSPSGLTPRDNQVRVGNFPEALSPRPKRATVTRQAGTPSLGRGAQRCQDSSASRQRGPSQMKGPCSLSRGSVPRRTRAWAVHLHTCAQVPWCEVQAATRVTSEGRSVTLLTANLATRLHAVAFPQVTENAEWHPMPKAVSVDPLREGGGGSPVLQIGSPVPCPSHRTLAGKSCFRSPFMIEGLGAITTKTRL